MTEPAVQPTSKAYERARGINGGPLFESDPDATHWHCLREPCFQVRHQASKWDGDMPVCAPRTPMIGRGVAL